jgi:NTP pyrophosphatase (non-canonical NTP hydrolase)
MITREQIFKTAINEYGIEAQLNQVAEEVGELLTAINKVRRAGGMLSGVNGNEIIKPEKYHTPEYALKYHNLCGEVADVQIMIDQLKLMLNPETITLIEERKIERLKNRLEL